MKPARTPLPAGLCPICCSAKSFVDQKTGKTFDFCGKACKQKAGEIGYDKASAQAAIAAATAAAKGGAVGTFAASFVPFELFCDMGCVAAYAKRPKAVAGHARPATWTPQNTKKRNCELVSVAQGAPEWCEVEGNMQLTMPSCQLLELKRIQNESLHEYYCMRRDLMAKISGNASQLERHVWHGTRSNDPKVVYEDVQEGFMMQYSAQGMWGRGLYFAENAAYSHNYSWDLGNGTRQMMYTKLLCGEEVNVMPNDNTLIAPPVKKAPVRYDTVTGTTNGSKVYIVYENGRAYPEYLVTYSN